MICLLILLIDICNATKSMSIAGFINTSVVLLASEQKFNLTFENKPKYINLTTRENNSYLIETIGIRKYMDCSSNFLEPRDFFLSSPIPDLQINQSVSFYCSLRFFSTRQSIVKSKINLESNNINISRISHRESERLLVLNFNYTVPNSPQEAYNHDQETFKCNAVNSHFFSPNSEINLEREGEEKTSVINQCIFHLNISYTPFIDSSVPTEILVCGEDKLKIECPIRAPRKSKILWIKKSANNQWNFLLEKNITNKREYLELDSLKNNEKVKCVINEYLEATIDIILIESTNCIRFFIFSLIYFVYILILLCFGAINLFFLKLKYVSSIL